MVGFSGCLCWWWGFEVVVLGHSEAFWVLFLSVFERIEVVWVCSLGVYLVFLLFHAFWCFASIGFRFLGVFGS